MNGQHPGSDEVDPATWIDPPPGTDEALETLRQQQQGKPNGQQQANGGPTPARAAADADDTAPDPDSLSAALAVSLGFNPAFEAIWNGSRSFDNSADADIALIAALRSILRHSFTRGEIRALLHEFAHGALPAKQAAGQGDAYFDAAWDAALKPQPPPAPPGPESESESEPDPGPVPASAAPDAQAATTVRAFNDRYFVVNENGKAIIYERKLDPVLNRRYYTRITFEDFKKLYANRSVRIRNKDGKRVYANAAKMWLESTKRRQYIGGIVFDPANRDVASDMLNLWQGFAVTPRQGSWAKLQTHLLTIICGGETALYDYVLDWMADLVQHPGKQGEVAIAMRGIEGCGKGILARAVKYLFGQHGLAISNARHLVGNFNMHLRDVVFLFVDEAFYAGDKQHVGVLKNLITEPYLTIEGKYQNAVQAPNFLHLMLASNEDWIVPVSLRSRRWLVLNVLADRVGDLAYFAALQTELDNGGYAAMLHDLLHRDISGANLRKVPATDALQEQRKRSLDTISRWWLDCLHRGYVFESRLGLEDHWQQWHDFLPMEVLFASYERYCREHHDHYPLSREMLGKWLREYGYKPDRIRKQAVGERIVEATTTDSSTGRSHTHRVAELVKHPQPTGYQLGPLTEARAAFSRHTGLTVEWDTDDDPTGAGLP